MADTRDLAPERPVDDDPLATTAGWGRWRWVFWVLVIGAVTAGAVLRFVTRSPLWLDETLSVNISRLPIADIPSALRHDGHPPLYYVLLHLWMKPFGQGDVAVRALSGLWSLVLFPLVWMAGRRFGGTRVAWFSVALLGMSPYAIRYGSETRMYAMVSVFALVGWLLADDALRSPSWPRLGGITVVTALLLWTHYWSMWLLATAGLALLVQAWRCRRDGRVDELRATIRVIGAIIVGGLLFVPWVPSLLYQGTHTGTPWARPVRPTEMLTFTVADLGGGGDSEAVLAGWLFTIAVIVGLTGRALDRFHVSIDARTRREGRTFAVLILGTMAIACAVGYATGATYASRYAAVFFPFLILLAAYGLDQFRSRPVVLSILAVLLILGGIGGVRSAFRDRSDSQRTAAAIEAAGRAGDLVIYCPDQLGPSTSRVLDPRFRQVTYPDFAAPDRVDWTDYTARLAAASPTRFAAEALRKAGDHRIFVVYSDAYTTHKKVCPALINALWARRSRSNLSEPTTAYEPSAAVLFRPPGG